MSVPEEDLLARPAPLLARRLLAAFREPLLLCGAGAVVVGCNESARSLLGGGPVGLSLQDALGADERELAQALDLWSGGGHMTPRRLATGRLAGGSIACEGALVSVEPRLLLVRLLPEDGVLQRFLEARRALVERRERIRRLEACTSQLEDQIDTLREEALTDPLTGLQNRRGLQRELERALARVRRAGTSLAALMVDIDHFKALNDSLGHASGDRALRSVARCLLATARRPADLVARVGGEEFVLLLEDCDLPGALERAEHARRAVRRLGLHNPGAGRPLSISVGVARSTAAELPPAPELLRRADEALYRAKRGGRDRVEGPGPAEEPGLTG